MAETTKYIRWLDELTNEDVPIVGGKNASLGEMIQSLQQEGVHVPGGFATTADAYRQFLTANELDEGLKDELDKLKNDKQSLDKTGKAIRKMIRQGEFPDDLADAVRAAYREMSERYEIEEVAVAVRSSATAEDLPEASFAGQQETYLNVTGEADLLDACRKCYASLFTDRAIAYEDKTEYFVDHLARGIAAIAASQYPEPAVVRMSDFKSNEYADLIGGSLFEPKEENPMLGFRGASRYYSDDYRDGFALECRAIKKARQQIGLDNIVMMIPFVRSPDEADRVAEVLAENGLKRGEDGLQVFMMCEIPSNSLLAEQFAERYDGFSIGSNDLTQLIMGVDRDSEKLEALFDERNEAVKKAIRDVIQRAHSKDCKVGICGQAPSDYPEFAQFLLECGIDSMSLNPDSVIKVIERLTQE